MQARLIFFEHLKSEFNPQLTSLGFSGDDRTYRRVRGDVISMVNIQEHRRGDRCCINLALHLTFLPASWARHSLSIDKLTAADCEFLWRLSPLHKRDYWWRYSRLFKSPVRCAGHLIRTFMERGEALFDRYRSADDFAGLFKPDDFTTGAWLKAEPDGIKPRRGALTMARIHLHLGRIAEAKAFAQAGMELISSATALAAEYRNILQVA